MNGFAASSETSEISEKEKDRSLLSDEAALIFPGKRKG
jgi:hypothetical protein